MLFTVFWRLPLGIQVMIIMGYYIIETIFNMALLMLLALVLFLVVFALSGLAKVRQKEINIYESEFLERSLNDHRSS